MQPRGSNPFNTGSRKASPSSQARSKAVRSLEWAAENAPPVSWSKAAMSAVEWLEVTCVHPEGVGREPSPHKKIDQTAIVPCFHTGPTDTDEAHRLCGQHPIQSYIMRFVYS